MANLVSLALAAEARGRAHELLDKAQRQTDRLRAEIEADARDLVQRQLRDDAIATRPGDQLKLPTSVAAYATRYVLADRREVIARARRHA